MDKLTNKVNPDLTKDTSKESSPNQLQLAVEQGREYLASVEEMTKNEAHDADIKEIHDYLVGCAVEHAEGMYHWENGELVWKNPTENENAHVEIAVADAIDGRFIPGLTVTVTITDSDGNDVGTYQLPYLWHPWLYHYGSNVKVPGTGQYKIDVNFDPPTYMRHDKVHGKRHSKRVETDFMINIKTGRKISD